MKFVVLGMKISGVGINSLTTEVICTPLPLDDQGPASVNANVKELLFLNHSSDLTNIQARVLCWCTFFCKCLYFVLV